MVSVESVPDLVQVRVILVPSTAIVATCVLLASSLRTMILVLLLACMSVELSVKVMERVFVPSYIPTDVVVRLLPANFDAHILTKTGVPLNPWAIF